VAANFSDGGLEVSLPGTVIHATPGATAGTVPANGFVAAIDPAPAP
jgi:hypothetical protein